MVFIPHGLDQIFFHPRGTLFPELAGVVAQGVMDTAPGRSRFQARCATLFTNHFPRLTNRLERLQARLRPVLAQLGTNAARRQEQGFTYLRQRMATRVAHLEGQLFDFTPQTVRLNPGQQLSLTHWLANVEKGEAALTEETNANGSKTLIVCSAPPEDSPLPPDGKEPGVKAPVGTDHGEKFLALWETRLLLSNGIYRVSMLIASEQPVFRGPDWPVRLRLLGSVETELDSAARDPRHAALTGTFVVATAPAPPTGDSEVIFQCLAYARNEHLTLRLSALLLDRLE